MALDVLEVLEGTGDLPAVDGLGGLAGVLERNTEVGTASAGGLGRLDFGGGVTDLLVGEKMVRMVFLQVFLQQEFLQEFSQSRRWWMIEKWRYRESCAQTGLQHTILTDCLVLLVENEVGVVRSQSSHAVAGRPCSHTKCGHEFSKVLALVAPALPAANRPPRGRLARRLRLPERKSAAGL